MKLFGREPALWVALITALITVLATLNLEFLDAGQAAAITVFLGSVIMAVTTRPIAPALFTGLLSSGVALAAEYGFHLPDVTVAALTVLVLTFCTLVGVRPQVEPQETPVSSS